jgi:hypothetical protein
VIDLKYNTTIHAIVLAIFYHMLKLLIIGDHSIQCKLSRFKQSRKCACWICKMYSTLVNSGDIPRKIVSGGMYMIKNSNKSIIFS